METPSKASISWQGQLMEAKKALTAAVHVLARLSRLCIETGGGVS